MVNGRQSTEKKSVDGGPWTFGTNREPQTVIDNTMQKNRGFTLLEILIALVIFTAGIAAIMTVFSSGLLSSSDVENTTIGMNLAQRRIEEMRNRDYDTGVVSEARSAVSGFAGFEREVVVTEPETDLKQVTVTTYWTFKGDDVSLSLVTYISRN